MAHVIKPKSAFHAQAVLVSGAVAPFHIGQGIVVNMVRQLAAHPAVGAHGIHLSLALRIALTCGIDHGGGHQRAGGARLHALAAAHAGALAHRIGKIKYHGGGSTPLRHADDIVTLHLAAGAHAQVAGNAGVQVNVHRRVAGIWLAHLWRSRCMVDGCFTAWR